MAALTANKTELTLQKRIDEDSIKQYATADEFYLNSLVGFKDGVVAPLGQQTGTGARFIGVCVKQESTSASGTKMIAVDTSGQTIINHAVTGASAATDVGAEVFCSTDNTSDMTLTESASTLPIGRVMRWYSSTLCDVKLYSNEESLDRYWRAVEDGVTYAATSASDNLTAASGGSAHVVHAQTYSIPASRLKAGSVVRIKYKIDVTAESSTDTLETKLYIGGTTLDLNGTVLMTTTAFDPSAATDYVIGDFELVALAAPSATTSCVGAGGWVTSDNGTDVRNSANLAATNLATNGALIVKVSSKWSSTTSGNNARLTLFIIDIL